LGEFLEGSVGWMKTTKRSLPILLVAGVLLISILACSGSSQEVSEEEKAAALNVIEWNLYYLGTENLQGAMNTIHDEAPGRDEMWQTHQDIFANFNIQYVILESEILSIDSNTARVRVVQVTRKLSGDLPFRDNQAEAIHTLKKSADGEWKLWASEIVDGSVKYLD
jgi:ketosteroid isomerase-like protein